MGLLPYSLRCIWDTLQEEQYKNTQLIVNFAEIYNENVFDLLAPISKDKKRIPLDVKEKENKSFFIKSKIVFT